jgi:hypothetical protein
MPKVDLRNEVGAIVHAVSNRVLSDHTTKNIYGNVNYAKTFLQGTVVNDFDGRAPGGKNAIWKLTVDFEMHSGEPTLGVQLKRVAVHRQHCTLGPVPAGKNPQCSVNFTDLIGEPDHAVKGSTTFLPNAEGRAAISSTIATASTAPRVLLLPASHITETVGDKIEVIIMPPALTPMDAAPHAAARTKKKRKKKRKKATPAAAPAAATGNASTATPTLTTAPATKKGKTTGKKKSAKPIDLRTSPMFLSTTDLAMHRVRAIVHQQKWVDGNAETIIGNVTNEPTSGRQWYQKGPSGKRIAPGNLDFVDMSPLAAFIHMMPLEQLDLMLELTSERLAAKKKKELPRQELLRWIGVCMLIASINFHGNRRKLWEGGGAASKYLPSYDLSATGMSRNRFDDIWYAVRWSRQPPEQPDGMSSEWYRWMLINDFVANINKYCQMTFVPGGHLEADESVIRWYGKGGAFVDAGLPMYLALECKPGNGGEIQNLADVALGIMLHLKVVTSANEEKAIARLRRR